MFRDFKTFLARGNVVDLAIAFVLGAAFGRVVSSFVTDILMPPVGLLLGRVDFSNLFVSLSGSYPTLAAAKAAGAATINYGVFLNTIIDFLIIAFAMFLVVRWVNKIRGAVPGTRDCPYCLSKIAANASRCPNCTSELVAADRPASQ